MAFNFDSVPSRIFPNISNKWTIYPRGVLPMWLADADFPCAKPIQNALRKQVEHGVLGYDLPSKHLFETISARMKKLYSWNVNPDWITCTSGVNNGYNIAARFLCSRSRGYVIQTPVYNHFHELGGAIQSKQYSVPLAKKMAGGRISYEVDFDAFGRALKKAGMFLLCHPHNPVGHVFSRSELKRMAKLCIENNVTIVSDEIHSELLLGVAEFQPLASLSRQFEKHSITLVSASKAFNVAGLGCGFAIIPDPEMKKKFEAVANGMSFEISTPGLAAAQVAFSGKADKWLSALRQYLTENRGFLLDYVATNMPGVRITKPDATYLAWLDFSDLKLKESPYDLFLNKAKVALSDGKIFGKEGEGHVRLNFGTSRKILNVGLDRMRKALEKII